MKKIYITIGILAGLLANAQINVQTGLNTSIGNENPFLDASGYVDSSNNVGKGLYFPTTDLTTWKFKLENVDPGRFSTYFDGMIVYNTGEGEPTTEASVGGVRKNLKRGFYYFKNPNQTFPDGSVKNGEWVRLSDSFAGNEEWKYNPDNEHIELVRSGEGEFKNKVYFDEKGRYKMLPTDVTFYEYYSGGTWKQAPLNTASSQILVRKMSKDMEYSDGEKILNMSTLLLNDETPPPSNGTHVVNNSKAVVIKGNTQNYRTVAGAYLAAVHNGSGRVNTLRGSYSNAKQYLGEVGEIYGAFNQASTYAEAGANTMYGVYAHTLTQRNVTKVGGAYGFYGGNSVVGNASINTLNALKVFNSIFNNSSPSITNMVGFSYSLKIDKKNNGTPTITNNYGLWLDDISGGTEKNYAIYTGLGDVRFGQFKEEGAPAERFLAVDADGKLVVGGSSANLISLWENDADNNLVKLKNLADGTTLRTDSGDDRNSVTIDNTGIVTAKGYRGYNDAEMFPDYVFENYYKGASAVKANYTFKNLDQVESFVKTNGHLPGYQSAKEVKAQGYVDIMKTQLTNVEKIEELYLHTIAQEKEIKAKEAKIAELEIRLSKLEQLLNK